MNASQTYNTLDEMEAKARAELEGMDQVQAITLIELARATCEAVAEVSKMQRRIEDCLNFQRALFESRIKKEKEPKGKAK